MKSAPKDCPCGSGKNYARCCGLFHASHLAPTAEALMRSRYSAFVLGLSDYILASWHPSTRPANLDEDGPAPRWIGLKVLSHSSDGETAEVAFIATYRIGGRAHHLHEKSRFVFENSHWYYVDGQFPD